MIQFFYPQTLKNVTIAIMDLFDDLTVVKYDENGVSAREYRVPILYGPVQKYHHDRIENHHFDISAVDTSGYTQVTEINQNYYLQTPRVVLTLNGITYNPDRCYGPNEFRSWLNETLELSGVDLESVFFDYQPTPYDLNYSLDIMTNSMEYFSQLMENILPYFNPKLYLRVKEFSFLNVDRDLPISIGSVPLEFSDELSDNDARMVNARLDMTVEAFLYKPWTYSKIIKVINSRYFVNTALVTTSATSAFTSGSVLVDSYSTSAFATSGDEYLLSAVLPTTYDFSGTYRKGDKSFNWFTDMTQNQDF